jgi:integrase
MTTLPPAAQALIQALADPRIDDAARAALSTALATALAPPAAPAGPASGASGQGRAEAPARAQRRAPAPQNARKAETLTLGKETVEALRLPTSGERYVYDTMCPQLAIRLRPGGKTYVVQMWDATRGRSVRVTLAKVDKLTPENARKRAFALVADVSQGLDVRKPAVEGLTVAELISKWHAEKARSVRTADELRTKALHYLGRLAHRRAAEVTRADIGTIHTHIATEARKRIHKRVGDVLQWVETGPPGLPATADKWRATLNAVFAWGMAKGLVLDNPAAGIDAAFDAKGAQRTNYLRGDELLRFWKALEADPDADTRDALLLLLYTGQRRGNVLAMRWADLDIGHGVWTLGAADTKQRKAQSTPLTAQARSILQRRHEDAASAWVFPATRIIATKAAADPEKTPELGPMSEARMRDAWVRICSAAELKDLRIHDLRHTAGSWLARLGANEAVRQKALGHQTPAMAARYSHLELDPVADAMQRMGDAIVAAATKPAAPVRAIKGGKK